MKLNPQYDFSKGKRGRIAPPEPEPKGAPREKTRTTIRLDEDLIDHFLKEADASGGAIGYQASSLDGQRSPPPACRRQSPTARRNPPPHPPRRDQSRKLNRPIKQERHSDDRREEGSGLGCGKCPAFAMPKIVDTPKTVKCQRRVITYLREWYTVTTVTGQATNYVRPSLSGA